MVISSHEKLASPTWFPEAACVGAQRRKMTEFYLLNRPKVDSDNLYAVPVASSKSAFLDACEEPPWCVRERLVTKYEREKPPLGE